MARPTLEPVIEAIELAQIGEITDADALRRAGIVLSRLDPEKPENVERVCQETGEGQHIPRINAAEARAILRALTEIDNG